MSEPDYDIDFETSCPKCNRSPIHSRSCPEILCQGGMIDESDEHYCTEGTVMVCCQECNGTGRHVWCPHCGADLSGENVYQNDDQNENE